MDDDADVRVLVMTRVRQLGWRVRGAASGAEALRSAADEPPVLVVLDVDLPDLDGWDVIARLHERAPTADVPVVVLSILDPPSPLPRPEVVAYLVKPFRAAELQGVVLGVIGPPG